MLALDCMLTFGQSFTGVALGPSLLQVKYNFSETQTGLIVSIAYLVSCFLTPVLGRIVDKRGGRSALIVAGGVVYLLMNFMILATGECDRCAISLVPYVFFGFSLAVYLAILWSLVCFLVEPKQVGIGYGLLISFQNIGCSILPPIYSHIEEETKEDESHGFFWVMVMFISVSALSLMLKICLVFWDKKCRGGIFDSRNPYEAFLDYVKQKRQL